MASLTGSFRQTNQPWWAAMAGRRDAMPILGGLQLSIVATAAVDYQSHCNELLAIIDHYPMV